ILRPYATFSHPNVLAGYLTIALAIVISNIKYQISKTQKYSSKVTQVILLTAVLSLGTIALFLTLSRVAILIWLCVMSYWLFVYLKHFFRSKIHIIYSLLLTPIILTGIFFLTPLHYRFF